MRHLFLIGATLLVSAQAHAQQAAANLRQIYGMNDVSFQGHGRTVAIIANGYFDRKLARQDLQTFSDLTGLVHAKLKYVVVGDEPDGNSPDYSTEVRIDMQMVHLMAPKAKIVIFVDNGAPGGALAALQAAVDYGVDIVSMSFGAPESHYNIPNWEAVFTAHPEITFIAASGDSGANGGNVAFPASSPEVLAVGGVNEDLTANPRGWVNSGGGRSGYFGTPDYQANLPIDLGGSRVLPDISMAATGPNTQIYSSYAGGFVHVNGTSISAPLLAGMVAVLDQGFGYSLGDLHGIIYAAVDEGLQTNYFRDPITGNNGFPTREGYDLVTGVGVPNLSLMFNLLTGN